MRITMGAAVVGSLSMGRGPSKQSMMDRATAEEKDIADTLGLASSFWR